MERPCVTYARMMLGTRVCTLRKEQKLTLRMFALIVGVNHVYIHDIEHGRGNPTLSTLAKLADGLGVELKDLFDY